MNRLKQIRKQKGFTQTELGRAIGKYQPFIYNIEKHYYVPIEEEKEKLTQVLGVSVTDIFSEDERLG